MADGEKAVRSPPRSEPGNSALRAQLDSLTLWHMLVKTQGGTSGASGTSNPESPTTARPLDFDDEPQETGVTTPTPNKALSSLDTGNEDAPPKPPRPLTPQQQAQKELKEAFPSIEDGVIKAVLVASNGDMERAFHALLGIASLAAVPLAG